MFRTYGTGYGLSNNGIGNSYIVVSLTDQSCGYISKCKCVTLNTIVTGTVETKIAHKNLETPYRSLVYIQYKESPGVLKGTNDDGSK